MEQKRFQQFKGIIIGLFGLSLVIIVHEFGHFLACKMFHIRTPIFSIGFDPRIAATKIGDTEFQIGALPLGGYVSINPHDLEAAAYWKKMIIIFAGVFNNILFAFILFFFMLLRTIKKPIPVIQTVKPGSAADRSGLQIGDRIIALDHEPLQHNSLSVLQKTLSHTKSNILLTVERDHHHVDLSVALRPEDHLYEPETEFLGATFKTVTVQRPPLRNIFLHAGTYLGKLCRRMGAVMESIFNTKHNGGIIGPFGIISGLGKSAEYSLDAFLFFIAIININVAFFNILPIPFFDGGKALQYTIEALFAGKLSSNAISFIYLVIIALFLLVIIFASMEGAKKRKVYETK